MSKLHHLFIKHLRTIYAGEKAMAVAWNTMSVKSVDSTLRNVFKLKAEENMAVLALLKKVFYELGTSADGETDAIIESFLHTANSGDGEYDTMHKALLLSGRAVAVYRTNAIKTAMSSAEDLGMFDVAEILNECLLATKFNRLTFELLKGEFEKRGIEVAEFEAA